MVNVVVGILLVAGLSELPFQYSALSNTTAITPEVMKSARDPDEQKL